MRVNCFVKALSIDELNLLFQLFDYNNPDEMIAENTREIAEGKIDIFGLFKDSRLIGEIRAAYVHNDEGFAVKDKRVYLFAFRVHNDFQGKGYGQLLMDKAISILEEKGYSEFTIGVEDDNETAIHIYSKLGFTQLICRVSEEYQGDSYEYGLYLKTIL